MPLIGLGTFESMDKDVIKKAIVEQKYRMIDTAARYGNEAQIGEGLSEIFQSGVLKREDIFVCTKLWLADVEDIEGACRASLKRLQLDQLDLYLVHWPTFVKKVTNEKGEEEFVQIKKTL